MPCEHCKNLDELDYELLEDDAPHHGADAICEACQAQYYKEWGTEDIFAYNDQAKINHSELKKFPF